MKNREYARFPRTSKDKSFGGWDGEEGERMYEESPHNVAFHLATLDLGGVLEWLVIPEDLEEEVGGMEFPASREGICANHVCLNRPDPVPLDEESGLCEDCWQSFKAIRLAYERGRGEEVFVRDLGRDAEDGAFLREEMSRM